MMKYNMGKFSRWLLTKIAKKIVIQSRSHKRNVIDYYKIIIKASIEEFNEDDQQTLINFIEDCHEIAIEESYEEIKEED